MCVCLKQKSKAVNNLHNHPGFTYINSDVNTEETAQSQVCVFACVSARLSWMTAHSPDGWNCPSEKILSLLHSNHQVCTENVNDGVDGKIHPKTLCYISWLCDARSITISLYIYIYLVIKWCSLLLCVPTLPTASAWVSESLSLPECFVETFCLMIPWS